MDEMDEFRNAEVTAAIADALAEVSDAEKIFEDLEARIARTRNCAPVDEGVDEGVDERTYRALDRSAAIEVLRASGATWTEIIAALDATDRKWTTEEAGSAATIRLVSAFPETDGARYDVVTNVD